ncbi:MAG: hypothetical protein WCT03_25550 [Candidatus Obscuribacterales bacterium]|jgi:hypothetical protein
MPNPDFVAESNAFKPSKDNNVSSNVFSNEAWDCIDKSGRKSTCATEGVAAGGKAVGAAASASVQRGDTSGNSLTKDMVQMPIVKNGELDLGAELLKQSMGDALKNKDKSIDNDASKDKDKNKEKDGGQKKKEECLDFNVEIEGYPKTIDDRKSQDRQHPQTQRGGEGGNRVSGFREHVPPSGKLDQEYGSFLDKLDDKIRLAS